MARTKGNVLERNREYMREFYRAHPRTPKSRRLQNIKYRYGLSPEEFLGKCEAQNHQCAICRQDCRLCVDHDHRTDKVRGLLCSKCNAAIGLLNDSADTILRASEYLRTYA